MIVAQRQVFCHPLYEPERGIGRLQKCQPARCATARKNVVLKGVHQLVHEHAFKALVIAGEGKQNTMANSLSYAAGALSQVARNVILAEVPT
jgi:hypothetical protein